MMFVFLVLDYLIFLPGPLGMYELAMTALASWLAVERIYAHFVLLIQEGGEEDGTEEDHEGPA